jgi:hypothetical protein
MKNRDNPLKRYFRSSDALRRYADKVQREQEREGVWEKEAKKPLTDEAFQRATKAFQERSEARNKYGVTLSVIILGIIVFIGLFIVGAFIGPGF